MSIKLGIGLLFLSIQIGEIYSTGKINLRLKEYGNPTATDAQGHCCDGIDVLGCPIGKCDHLLRICVLKNIQSNTTDCLQSSDITGPSDQNTITFDSSQQPVQFDFSTWKGEVHIHIDVFDSNTDGNVLVDQFTLSYNSSNADYNQTSSSPKVYNLIGSRNISATRLSLSLSVFCADQYYGDDCSVKCVPTNQCGGHYTCDNKGNKLCLPGWRGTDCTEQIPGSAVDCSVYTDKSEFVPSAWEGLYTCSGDSAQHRLFMNVTKPKDSLTIVADVSLGSSVIQLPGTYSSFSHALALQEDSTVFSLGNKNVTKILIELGEKNSSSMHGQLSLYYESGDKLTCSIDPLNLKIAYFDGCDFKGTCVRYGKTKQEYYCCCNDGSIGQSCSKKTTMKPTILTTHSTVASTTVTTAKTTITASMTSTDALTTESPSTPAVTTESMSTQSPTTESTSTSAPLTSTAAPTTSTAEPTTSTIAPTTSTSEPTSSKAPITSTAAPTTGTDVPTTSTVAPPSTEAVTPTTTGAKSTQSQTTSTGAPTTTRPPVTTDTVSTSELTTSAPTTQPPQPTTSTPTPTTSMPEVTTSLPMTTSTTTEIPTTKTMSTSVVMTTQSTLKTTTGHMTTGLTSTVSPTLSQSSTYRVNLLLVLPELDGQFVMDVMLRSWSIENKDKVIVTPNNTQIELTEYFETIADGQPVTVIFYKVNHTPSNVILKPPSNATIIDQLKIQYNTNQTLLYTGSGPCYNLLYGLKFYVHGPGPMDTERQQWEAAIVSALNKSCETNGNCIADDETKAVIRMTEEYVGDDGNELTEISYFIEFFGQTIHRENYTGVSLDNYTDAFREAGIKSVIYKGKKTLRYRYHHKIFIIGKVFQESMDNFTQALKDTWFTTYPGIYTGCRDCYAQIVRQEKYLDDSGKEITALVYFFYFHSILQVPINFPEPNITMMKDHIHVKNVNYLPYQLYTGQTYYRYRYHFGLMVEGMVDGRDFTKIKNNLQASLLNFTSRYSQVQLLTIGSDVMLNDQGDFVTEIVVFMEQDKKIQDSRVLTLTSHTWLNNWFVHQIVLKRNDKAYVIHTSKEQLYHSDEIFMLFIDGFVMATDVDVLHSIIVTAWDDVLNKTAKVEVDIIKTEMFIQKTSRKYVTGFHYILKLNGSLQNIRLMSDFQKRFGLQMIRTLLLINTYNLTYEVHKMTSLLLPYHQQYELYFHTELSSLELEQNISTLIKNALKSKWIDYTMYTNLEVHIAFQEKVYVGRSHIESWRVVYFLTYEINNHTIVIDPEFVVPITETILLDTLTWTGLNGMKYKLYTGVRTSSILYSLQHFNLLMTREVSVFDWKKIETDLQLKWCTHLSCVNNGSISITITDLEKYVDQNGNFYFNLVYFVHQSSHILDSRRYKDISVTKNMFKWTNEYEGVYEVVVTKPVALWKYAYGFHLYGNDSVTMDLKSLTNALVKAWYKMGIATESCKCLRIQIGHQRLITDTSGNIAWELTYFIYYNGHLVHSTTWPALNPGLIETDSQWSFRILTNINTKLYQNLLSFYSNYKLSKEHLLTLERQITNKIVETKSEYRTCRCVSVKIVSQEQVVNSHGESSWKISYQVYKNNQVLKSWTIHSLKWATFNFNMTNVYGQKYHFFWSWTDWQKYIHYYNLGGLYVGTWVPPTYGPKFETALYEYYRKYYQGKSVSVVVLNTTKEYYTLQGVKSWKVPFILKVDGKTVNPPGLNTTEFESLLNFTATNGQSYKLVTGGRHTIDAQNVFSVNLNHKVATTDYEKMKEAVITGWCTEHPEIDPSTIIVDITGQEELIDKTTGESSWKLLYTLSVNGTKIDKRTQIGLTNSQLSTHLNFTSTKGVTYSTVDHKTFVSQSHMYQLYFKSFVSKTDFQLVAKQLKSVWTTKLKELGISKVDVQFVRQKEVVTETGERVWKWEYVLNINNSVQIPTTLPAISFNSTEEAFLNSTTTSGMNFHLVVPSTSFIDYDKYFSLYITSKATNNALENFKEKIILAWKNRGMNVSIGVLKQEELVNRIDGHSVWRLVYFLKKEGQVLDSRTTVDINATSIHGVEGPRGSYKVLEKVDPTLLVPYKWSSSVTVNHKFSREAVQKMSVLLQQMVEKKLHLIEEKYSVCNEVPADIQFLLDASGSVKDYNFIKQKDFVSKFAESFTIGPDNIQIGVTTFASNVRNQFFMNKYSDKPDLITAIKIVPYSTGGTNTHGALKWIGSNAFEKSSGDRSDAANILIVMTDGKSQNASKTKQEADRLHQAGIRVFSIGIGSGAVKSELESIASRHENVFTVESFDALGSIITTLKKSTCKEVIVNTTVVENTVKNVTVNIKRQEEYITETGKTVWKLVYFVRVDGKLVPATSLPNLDLKQLVTSMNITGPRGQKYQILKGDNSSIYNYRNRFSIFFNKKVTEESLTKIQTALLSTWNSTVKEYSTCGCLSIIDIKKENIEEFVDKDGKSVWRLIYFLKKNNTVVESMTHTKIDLNALKQKITGITNIKHEQYEVAKVTESQLYRRKMAFSFFLKTEVGYNQTDKLKDDIKQMWIQKQTGTFTSNNTEVIVNRYMKYTDLKTKTVVWKVEYYLKKDGIVINPSVTPELRHINLTITNTMGDNYEVVKPIEEVDNRFRFTLFLNKPVRTTDILKFKSVIQKYWIFVNNLDNKTNIEVEIPEQTAVLKGNSKYWMLSIFIKKGTTFIDSRETRDLNTTQIQHLINFQGVNNEEYKLHETVENYKRIDGAFSLYLNTALKRTQITAVLTNIKKVWKENDSKSNVSIELGNQEWYLNKNKPGHRFSKLTYFLKVNNQDIHPNQVPDMLPTLQKNILGGKGVTTSVGMYSYNSLFYIDFTLPVLKTDMSKMEKQLALIWDGYKKSIRPPKVEIFNQEELVTLNGSSIWRLHYRLTSQNTTVSPSEESTVTTDVLQKNLTETRTGSKENYGTLVGSVVSAYSYKDLFSFHVSQRVAVKDYEKFEGQLKLLWQKSYGTNINGIHVLKQEQTIDVMGKVSWKLSYQVMTTDRTLIDNKYEPSPLFTELKTHVAVMNPISQIYRLVEVKETYRLSQAFTVIMNRQIYNVDQVRFEGAVKISLQKSLKASKLSDISLVVSSKEMVVSSKSEIAWRYNYIVNMSGNVLDSKEEVGIGQQDLQTVVNFTSPRNKPYTVLTSVEKYIAYTDMFYISFYGIISVSQEATIIKMLKSYVENLTMSSNIKLTSMLREDFIEDITGKSVTRYRFGVTSAGRIVYPSLINPRNTNLSIPDVKIAAGPMYKYSECYKLVLYSQHRPINTSALHSVIKSVWKQHKNDKKDYKVFVISTEQSVGGFGVHLISVLYIIGLDTRITPDMELEPDANVFKTEFDRLGNIGKVYKATTHRIQSLYHISLKHGSKITVTDRETIETQLRMAVASEISESKENIETEVLYSKNYVSTDTSTQISRLYYQLKSNNQTVQPWENNLSGLSAKLNLQPLTHLELVTNTSQRAVYNVYLKGKIRKTYNVQTALKISWMSVVSSTQYTVQITIVRIYTYIDVNWNIVTRVSYIVSINNKDPESLNVEPPTFSAIESTLKGRGMSQCGCGATSLRKHYVYSKTIDAIKVKQAISTVWKSKNKDLIDSSLTVRVKPQSTRHKRATNPAHKLVDKDGKEVTPMEYTVAVEDQEPQSLFVSSPSNNDIKEPLKQAGSDPCLCKPKLAGSLLLDGQTNDAEKDKVADAIKDAFVKENPDLSKADLDVAVTDIDNTAKDKDGKPVSEVQYRVGHKTEDVEDLQSPSTVHFQQALATAGKTLHSKSQKPAEEEEEDWVIPLAIALGVLAGIIVIAIIIYVIHKRRHRKRGDLVKRENDLKTTNSYDEEHFSNPAAYDNKAYELSREGSFRKVSKHPM